MTDKPTAPRNVHTQPAVTNALAIQAFTPEADLASTIGALIDKTLDAKLNSLMDIEGTAGTLVAQAATLDTIFTTLARRAAANMDTHLQATESYLRLALKAQAQCRATLETLAEIKNPRQVSIVQQANIAHGPQQVNNAAPPPAQGTVTTQARTENSGKPSNELLEQQHGARMDTGTKGAPGRAHPQLETLEKRQRPEN